MVDRGAGRAKCRAHDRATRRRMLTAVALVALEATFLACQAPGVAGETKGAGGTKASASPSALPESPALPVPAPAREAQPEPSTPAANEAAPEQWSQSEVADALRACEGIATEVRARFEVLPPRREGACGAPAPIRLAAIEGAAPVRFTPAPVVTCDMLRGLARWIDDSLQPLAERLLDSAVREIRVVSSYACRPRYGRKGARMSEHAFANALDIAGFELADGRHVNVLEDWGQTKRDLAAAAAAAREAALRTPPTPVSVAAARAGSNGASGARGAAKPTSPAPRQTNTAVKVARTTRAQSSAGAPPRMPPLPQRRPPRGPFGTWRTVASTTVDAKPTAAPARRTAENGAGRNASVRRETSAGRKTRAASTSDVVGQGTATARPASPLDGPGRDRARFLRETHKAACRVFGTTLGPEANEAHRDHFHVDMFPRRSRGYCE